MPVKILPAKKVLVFQKENKNIMDFLNDNFEYKPHCNEYCELPLTGARIELKWDNSSFSLRCQTAIDSDQCD